MLVFIVREIHSSLSFRFQITGEIPAICFNVTIGVHPIRVQSLYKYRWNKPINY